MGILFSDNPQTFPVDWVPDNQHEENAKFGDKGGASPDLETGASSGGELGLIVNSH